MSLAATVGPPQADLEISQKMSVGKASLLMSGMIALSRITGFGRLMLTTHLYGRGPTTDAYNAAFNIPDTITIILAGGALATGFVPVFTEYIARNKHEEARRTFRAMFTLLGVVFGLVTVVLFALTYTPFGTLLAPHQVSHQYVDLYLRMLRILLVAQFVYVLGGMFSGTLNALRLFIYPALQPVMFNLGIIGLGIVGPFFMGMGIESQAWGALAGAIVGSLLIQMPAVLRNGLSLIPLWDLRDRGVRRVVLSLLPIVFGLASGQIIAFNLPRFIGTGLPAGELSALDYANRLMQVPLDLLASGPAIALFPTLSLLGAQGKRGEMRDMLAVALRRTLVLTVLASALLMALRFPIIHLLLEHGHFTVDDTKFTAAVLQCYGLCVVGLGAQQMLARGYYALGDTRAPVVIGVGAMLIFGGFGVVALHRPPHDPAAPRLAMASALAITALAVCMWVVLDIKLKGWDQGATFKSLARALAGGVAAYYAALAVAHNGIGYIVTHNLDNNLTPSIVKLLARTGVVLAGGTVGILVFVVVLKLLHADELGSFGSRWKFGNRRIRLFEGADL